LSFERAVESAAVFFALTGAASLVLWAFLRHRVPRLRPLLLTFSLLSVAAGAALGAWAWHETRPRDVRGSPTIEFSPNLGGRQDRKQAQELGRREPWPTYGRDLQRTHFAPFRHQPPFR
jgi:hypothetical protein